MEVESANRTPVSGENWENGDVPSGLELTLTPHELFALPLGTPATGPAVRVEVTPDDRPAFFALARLVHIGEAGKGYKSKGDLYRIFLRDEQRPEDAIFARGRIFVKDEDSPLSNEELLHRVSKSVNRGGFARFWKSPELEYGLVLHSFTLGNIIRQGRPNALSSDLSLDFYWAHADDGKSFLEWSTPDFYNFCHQMVADPASEFNFLLRWQSLSSKEKTAFAIRCERGDWDQLMRLCTWVLQLIAYHFGPYPYGDGNGSTWDFPRHIPERYDRPAVFFARRWQDALFQIVRPAFWPYYPLCAHQWRMQKTGVENHVFCETPTAHEFMEAQLGLREFLRPHLSEGEIEALFNPGSEGLLP